MSETLQFEIVTQVSAVFAADVASITLPGATGEMGLLPGHRPLVTLIQPGTVVATEADGTVHHFMVSDGFAEVSDDRATLIVQDCEGAAAIEIDEARKRFADLEAKVGKGDFASSEEMAKEAARLARARARVEAFELATGKGSN